MRRTKIVCTLGLASQTTEVIEGLMDAGMNVARFNFSHGTHESHKKTYDIVDHLRTKKELPVATLLDTKGPEIRLGLFEEGRVTLEKGQDFVLTTQEIQGTVERVSISYEGLPGDVAAGTAILLDDGLIELKVTQVVGGEIHCRVVNGGEISNRKGVNLPGTSLSMPYLSDRDREDLLFGIHTGFEFVAASFARTAQDVLEIRKFLHENGGEHIRIIAKIENAQGVENIDEILRVSDGIMVARGDMGVEIDFDQLPALQKLLIKKAYNFGRMVITATQMLESMMHNPRPTRAEATDVANAIYDGTSAIMLSGETAAGKYPVQAVQTMDRIARQTESDINYRGRFHTVSYEVQKDNVTNAISHATVTTAYDLGATAILAVSLSGRTARNVSKFRPEIPILGCTTSQVSYYQLALSWGVVPVLIQTEEDLNQLFENAVDAALALDLVKSGDVVVITTGVPLGVSGTTNLLKVHVAGDVLAKGTGVGGGNACGRLCVVHSEKEAHLNFREGDILVIDRTSNDLLPLVKRAAALITEEEGLNSHGAIAGLTLGIPVIVGVRGAAHLLKNGTIVMVDAHRGVVCSASGGTANPS